MTYSEIRQAARDNLRGNYWQAVLVGFVAALCGAVLAGGTVFTAKVDAEVLGVSRGDKGKNAFEYGLGVGAGLDVSITINPFSV